MADRVGVPVKATVDRDLDRLLRQCIQCGLCLPHCATWLATGHDAQSPRGRLLLLADMLNNGAAKEKQRTYREAFDQCIGCRACEAACPSGVPFSLLEHGQHLARGGAAGREKAVPDDAVPDWVVRRLDSVAFLRGLRMVGAVGRAVLRSSHGDHWRRRLARSGGKGPRVARLLGSLPTSPLTDEGLVRRLDGIRGVRSRWEVPAAGDGSAGEVLFFAGCANDGLLPGTSRRLKELLSAAGCRILTPTGQTCCGALAGHTGRPGRQAAFRRTNREALAGKCPIVVEAAGCGLELKNDEPAFAARIVDASQLLERLTLPPLAPLALKVAVHDPCHARHGQGIVTEPRALLARIPGVTVLEPAEAEVCCGAGGAWGLRYPDLSAELGSRKARYLVATGADLIVTANPGCLGQIADGLLEGESGIPVMPLSDLLWYASAVGAADV